MSTIKVNKLQNLDGQEIYDASSGTLVLPAGSASRAPLRLSSGTSLTSPSSGSIEYNGNNFLMTSNSVSGRAVNDESLFFSLDADRTIVGTVVGSTFYDIFGVGITLPAGGAYVFDILVGLRTGTTSHTVSFAFGGTATIDKIQFKTDFTNLALSTGGAAPGTPTAGVTLMFTGNPSSAANGVISPASVLASKFFRVNGVIETSTQGTLRPQIAFSANPTGTNQVTRLSYIRMNPIGVNTGDISAGTWAA